MKASITLSTPLLHALRSTCNSGPKTLCKTVPERAHYMQKAALSNAAFHGGLAHRASPYSMKDLAVSIQKAHMSTEPVNKIEPGMTVSMATANRKDVLKYDIAQNVAKFRSHATDTGSSSVQIAVMTQKIQNFTKHALMHKKDKASMRGFQMLVQKRRKMLKYLKKNDFEEFKKVIMELKLENEARRISSNKKYS